MDPTEARAEPEEKRYVSVGHGVSPLRWRSRSVKHP